jgi:hypothetical protein
LSTGSANPSSSAAGSGSPTPRPSSGLGEVDLSALHWYEVRRVHNAQGGESRTLLIGSLGGRVYGEIPLGQLGFSEARGGLETFAWTDPQADGIYGRSVLVWGRNGQARMIEAVKVDDASITPLVEASGTVEVATADAGLSRIFFVTADEASGQPTGLWVDTLGDKDGATRLDYKFSTRAVSNAFKYRLIANFDGSIVAVQPDDESITLVDVNTNLSHEVDPGGPMIGFADDQLIALGATSASDRRDVIAFDPHSLDGRVVLTDMNSAQVVRGSDTDLIAAMRIDATEARSFGLFVTALRGEEAHLVYKQDPAELGPELPRRDRAFLGAQVPADWVLLVDSFYQFIEGSGKEPSLSQYPKLLNLRTGETIRIGPFITAP